MAMHALLEPLVARGRKQVLVPQKALFGPGDDVTTGPWLARRWRLSQQRRNKRQVTRENLRQGIRLRLGESGGFLDFYKSIFYLNSSDINGGF